MPCRDYWSDEDRHKANLGNHVCSYEFSLHHYIVEIELERLRYLIENQIQNGNLKKQDLRVRSPHWNASNKIIEKFRQENGRSPDANEFYKLCENWGKDNAGI